MYLNESKLKVYPTDFMETTTTHCTNLKNIFYKLVTIVFCKLSYLQAKKKR